MLDKEPLCQHCSKRKVSVTSSRGLCRRCSNDLSIRKQYPCKLELLQASRTPCSRCGINVASDRMDGLCRKCSDAEIVRRVQAPIERRSRKPVRKPGDPKYRCFWCMYFRCDRVISLCSECQAWLDAQRLILREIDDVEVP